MHNKALWTSFLFKHGSWCVSFTCLSLCSFKMTSQTIEEKTLTNKIFRHLSLYCIFFFFIFPSFWSFYFFFCYCLFFYFLLLPMLILTGLSLCHKCELHFIALMPQIKGTFIKIERFIMKPYPSQRKMTRVRGTNIT